MDSNSKSKRLIAIIDDEANILSSLNRLFKRAGYEVFTTSDAQDLWKFLAESPVAVLISDQRMPKVEGTEVLNKAKEISPDTIRIMLTGYADIQAAMDAVNKGHIYRFLTKPWNDDDLRITVDQAFQQFELVQDNRRLNQELKNKNSELRDLNTDLDKRVKMRTAEVQELNRQLEYSFLESIKVIGALVELGRPDEIGKAKRIAKLAGGIAKEMGLEDKQRFDLQAAAYLHDIGHVAFEDRKNPTQEEWKLHPEHGSQILRMIPRLSGAADIILQHHENSNGTGFPKGISSTDIRLEAQIIAVCDAYEGAIQNQKQDHVMTPERALKEVQLGVPDRFLPEVVGALLSYLEKSGELKEDLHETQVELYSLKEGMVLARPILTLDGKVLLGKDYRITKDILGRLWKRHVESPVRGDVYIYRRTAIGKVS